MQANGPDMGKIYCRLSEFRLAMKILFVYSGESRCGIADYATNLLQALTKLADVEVVFMPRFAMPAGSPANCVMNARRAYSFGRSMKTGDICHIQHEYALWGGARPVGNVFPFFTAAIRMPVVLTMHELAPIYRAADIRGHFTSLLAAPIRPFADHYSDYINRRMFDLPQKLIVHTEEQRHELLHRGVPADKIHCIPHGIPDLNSSSFEENAVTRFGLKHTRYLVIIGFISRRKGYHLAIEALKLLSPDIHLVFAGGSRTSDDAVYESELRQFISQQGLIGRVTITGYLDMASLKTMIRESLLVLAPFHAMSGSGSLSLALSLGKAILAARLPETEELARHSKAIELCNRGEHIDLATKTIKLLANPEKISMLGQEAKRYAADMSFAIVAAQTVRLYEKILRSKES